MDFLIIKGIDIMKYELMISQIDEHNESTLILCKKYSIKNVFYLINNNDLNEFI